MNPEEFQKLKAEVARLKIDALIKRNALKELAKTDYLSYVKYVHHGLYKQSRHNAYICSKIQDMMDGKIKKLMIFMPPRHGKSMTASESISSFFLGKNPDKRVIMVSYGDSLAQRFGKLNRRKMQEFGQELFGVEVSKEKSSMTDWDIEGHRGGMLSVGIGGGITGQGADLLVIDDPIKNREEADSEVQREKIWMEYKDTLLTRLHAGGSIIIILTRWHEDDLVGRILNDPENPEEAKEWTIINLPAIAEENDQLGRAVGEALWPEYGYDKDWCTKKEKEVGARTWNALYQQRPSAQEGNLIKRAWWQYYTVLPEKFDEVIQSWDLTFKDSDGSDYVVGQVWGRIGAKKYLIDQVRARMNFTETIEAIRTMSKKYPEAYGKLIEDKANGSAVINVLQYELGGIIAIKPKESKLARASAVTYDIEAGNVYLPKYAAFTIGLVDEAAAFPNAAHDDQVDSMTQALNRLIFHSTPTAQLQVPDNLPEDLNEDLRNDPEALRHYLSTRGN